MNKLDIYLHRSISIRMLHAMEQLEQLWVDVVLVNSEDQSMNPYEFKFDLFYKLHSTIHTNIN